MLLPPLPLPTLPSLPRSSWGRRLQDCCCHSHRWGQGPRPLCLAGRTRSGRARGSHHGTGPTVDTLREAAGVRHTHIPVHRRLHNGTMDHAYRFNVPYLYILTTINFGILRYRNIYQVMIR